MEAFLLKNVRILNILKVLKISWVSEKAKLAREISDGKNEIPHKFLGRKI